MSELAEIIVLEAIADSRDRFNLCINAFGLKNFLDIIPHLIDRIIGMDDTHENKFKLMCINWLALCECLREICDAKNND